MKYAYDWLEKSSDILKERGKEYDTTEKEPSGGERSMEKTVQMFNICTGKDLTESEGWLLLQLLKDVRQWTKPDFHGDSALDCISYAALKAEALDKEQVVHSASLSEITKL
jgi:hypothetical protein